MYAKSESTEKEGSFACFIPHIFSFKTEKLNGSSYQNKAVRNWTKLSISATFIITFRRLNKKCRSQQITMSLEILSRLYNQQTEKSPCSPSNTTLQYISWHYYIYYRGNCISLGRYTLWQFYMIALSRLFSSLTDNLVYRTILLILRGL